MTIFAFFRKIDGILLTASILSVAVGLFSIYSITQGGPLQVKLTKQFIFLLIGMIGMGAVAYLDFRVLNHTQIIFFLYAVSNVLLAAVFFWGTEIRGVSQWFRIGPLSFQPVEFAKITSILILAKYFSMRHIEIARFRHILVSGFYIALPVVLLLLQPDLGSISIFIILWAGTMIIAGIRIRHLAMLTGAGIVIAVLAWTLVLKDYQKDRIFTFLNPTRDPLGSSYNVSQSMIAIGSGGIWGKGLGMGTQSQAGFLPESTTDFIFASLTEEMGLVGGLFLFFLFGIFFWRLFRISTGAQNNFGRFIVVGVSLVFISEIFINIGMTMGLFPVTGIPLPFVSYGGSALITSFVMLGLCQSINIYT